MPATGQVRQLSPAAVERIVTILERLVGQMRAEIELILEILAMLDPVYRGMAESRRGARRYPIGGRQVPLSPVPAAVLEILASGAGPGARPWSTEAIRSRLAAARKKNVTGRSVVQAVYRIRQAFKAAGLTGNLIRNHGDSWELTISAADLAALRKASDKG
jgi:hypothetical protein